MKSADYKKYSIFQNTVYLAKESWAYDKRILIFSAISILTGIILPVLKLYLPKTAVDLFVEYADGHRIAITLGGIVGLILIFQALNDYLYHAKYYFYNDIKNVFIQKIFLTSIDCRYCAAENGNTVQDYRKAINVVQEGDASATSKFYQIIPQFLISVSCFFLYTGILSTLHIFVVFLLLLSSLITYWFQKKETICYEKTKDIFAKIQRKLYYCINCGSWAGKDIRVFHMQKWIAGLIGRWQRESEKVRWKRGMQSLKTYIVSCLLNFLRDSLAYIYLIVKTMQGEIGAGDFMLYFGAIVGFSDWILHIVRQVGNLKTANAGINDLRGYLSLSAEDLAEGEEELPDLSEGVEIVFDHVYFSYPGSERPVIQDLSFQIKKGEHIALVGLNGAGKTTLVKLMAGFYEADSGQIRINGVDIQKLRKKDVYSLYTAVFQDIMVLPFMLDENIALQPKQQIDRARVREVLKKAGLWDELRRKGITEDSYMTHQLTDDGIFLSGGQEQRLMLARALYKKAPVLLLDEPTASLDPLAEKEIYERYQELCGGRTALFISHRLASTQFSDRIFFLKEGQVAECGTHKELMDLDGEYAHLYDVQSYYYNLSEEAGGEPDECYE